MTLKIYNTIEHFDKKKLPLRKAFKATEAAINKTLNITLIFQSTDTMFQINNQLRGKPSATDVLSLPFEPNEGEIYICPDFIYQQGYNDNRIIHLWVHGLLHIAGFTHDADQDFTIMKSLEITILNTIGLPNPY